MLLQRNESQIKGLEGIDFIGRAKHFDVSETR